MGFRDVHVSDSFIFELTEVECWDGREGSHGEIWPSVGESKESAVAAAAAASMIPGTHKFPPVEGMSVGRGRGHGLGLIVFAAEFLGCQASAQPALVMISFLKKKTIIK